MGALKMVLLTMLALGAPIAMASVLFGGSIATPGIDNALGELNSAVSDAARIFDSDSPPTVGQAVDGDDATDDPDMTFVATPSSQAPVSPIVLYVGQTGGYGVALRDACADAARLGTAWADDTAVEVITEGAGECEGWVLVDSGGVESWVRSGFLIDLPLGAVPPRTSFAAPGTPTQ